jgi:hypothetical protein
MTESITVYGASDDLIEVEGALRQEFTYQNDDDGDLLTFGDGTALSVRYDSHGMWRITRLVIGSSEMTKTEATDPDDDYSDRVTLTAPAGLGLGWVSHCNTLHKIGGRP